MITHVHLEQKMTLKNIDNPKNTDDTKNEDGPYNEHGPKVED